MSDHESRRNTTRSTGSCERCKERKIKCDRQLPACRRCLRGETVCEYAGRRKPGFPAGQRQLMETRIMRLESELSALRGNGDDTSRLGTATPLGLSSTTVPPRESSMAEAFSGALDSAQDGPSPTYERTRSIKERKPPADLVFALTSLYFRHIHPWLPFLDVERVYADMECMDEPTLLHHALFGISLPHSFDSRLDKASSDSYWKYSKRRIFVEVLEEPSYRSLEVLTILVLDLSGMTHGPQVWGALAVATRLAIQLGIPQGLGFRTSAGTQNQRVVNQADRIFRQRLFWAIYAVDCYVCITTNHLSTLGDEQVQYFLPTRHQVWTGGYDEVELTPASVFGHELELLDLSRRAHRLGVAYLTLPDDPDTRAQWFDGIRGISSELKRWLPMLPSHLRLSDTTGEPTHRVVRPTAIMLHGFYHALVIYVNAFATAPTKSSASDHTHDATRQQCLEECLHSIEALSQLVAKVATEAAESLGWPFAWAVWVAARFLLVQMYNLQQSDSQTMATLSLFSNFLVKMGRYWQISLKYSRLLQRAMSEISSGTPQRPNSVLSLMADLRVSTSHLEDQFRPDPIIHCDEVDSVPSDPHAGPSFMPLESLGDNFANLSDNMVFDLIQPTGDTWFCEPLFASSAYQQYDTGGNS